VTENWRLAKADGGRVAGDRIHRRLERAEEGLRIGIFASMEGKE
jgi:hypothetical protein